MFHGARYSRCSRRQCDNHFSQVVHYSSNGLVYTWPVWRVHNGSPSVIFANIVISECTSKASALHNALLPGNMLLTICAQRGKANVFFVSTVLLLIFV